MKSIVNVVLVLGLLQHLAGSYRTTCDDYTHKMMLDTVGNFQLFWKINKTHMHITQEIHGKTTGWVGVGITPKRDMINADMYVGWVKEGTAYVTDRHGLERNTFPPKDASQDAELIEGLELDGWTVIKFRRPLAACEADSDIAIQKQEQSDTIKVVWAFGANDPSGDDLSKSDYHGHGRNQRGTKLLQQDFFEEVGSFGRRHFHHRVISEEDQSTEAPSCANQTTAKPAAGVSDTCYTQAPGAAAIMSPVWRDVIMLLTMSWSVL